MEYEFNTLYQEVILPEMNEMIETKRKKILDRYVHNIRQPCLSEYKPKDLPFSGNRSSKQEHQQQ